MKRYAIYVLSTLFILVPLLSEVHASEEKTIQLATNAKAAILLDSDTGEVLYEKNADQKLPPASITKIMTLLLVMEGIAKGEISLKDKVRTSEHAASMGGSQIFLEVGEEMTVEDLIKGVAVASANDASVALAEYLAGTEGAFVERMNQRAKELGLHNTNFVNSNGLPVANHYSTARDIAKMSRELLRYEWITKYTGIYEDYLRKDSDRPFWLVNTNRLVRFYPGLDGLKTGFTNEARYCLAATAKKENFRLVAVVLGEPDSKSRSREITQMFDYAFTQYSKTKLYDKDQEVTRVKVDKGNVEEIGAVTPYQFGVLNKRGQKTDDYRQEIVVQNYVQAPIKKGDVIGHILLKNNEQTISQIDLVAAENSERAKYRTILLRTFKHMISH